MKYPLRLFKSGTLSIVIFDHLVKNTVNGCGIKLHHNKILNTLGSLNPARLQASML